MEGSTFRRYAVPQSTFDASMGALLLGVFSQSIWYGNLTTMMWEYRKGWQADSRFTRVLFICAWLLCTTSLAIDMQALYYFLYASVNATSTSAESTTLKEVIALTEGPWGVCIILVINELVVIAVRFMFLRRIYKLSRLRDELGYIRTGLLIFIALLSAIDFFSAVGISVELYSHSSSRSESKALYVVMFAVGVIADILLTGLLCWSLRRSRTGTPRTDSALKLLILYSINTGLFPSLIASAGMIAYFASPDTYIYIPFYIQISTLYLISLIASYNHRASVRQQIERPLTVDFGAFDAVVPASDTTRRDSALPTFRDSRSTMMELDVEKDSPSLYHPDPHQDDAWQGSELDLSDAIRRSLAIARADVEAVPRT
ncbi:hypothetical protein B0H21DRAFT_539967 [Amylocystis lapponica]|nr:hypothetical protein B0H21DRAFT_539967 [Amylocystis lapponica]